MSTFRSGFEKLADIASASAITTGGDGSYHDVTGTVPVNSIASRKAASVVMLRLISGGLKFIHLTGTLNMRGKVDFTSTAGDLIYFISEGAGEWSEFGRSSSGGSLQLGLELTLTMETGANWFTVSSPPTIGNVAGCKFTITPTLTMPTGACWFTTSFSLCNFACQCNC